MNSSFPPRASRTLGTTATSFQQENRPLPSAATKDTSPALGISSNSVLMRSPFESLGVNAGMGLRQRRPGDAKANQNLPPKLSLTMMSNNGNKAGGGLTAMTPAATGIAGSAAVPNSHLMESTTMATPNITEEHWVIVYGISGAEERKEVINKFRQVGDMTSVKMGSQHTNWIAISFDSALAVEQALIKRGSRLSNGHIFGVQRLNNPREFFMKEFTEFGSVVTTSSSSGNKVEADNPRVLFKDDTPGNEKQVNTKELTEDSILLTNSKKSASNNKTVCEIFMAWVYGW